MEERQLYGQAFETKRELLAWLDEYSDRIDWTATVGVEWYNKEDSGN